MTKVWLRGIWLCLRECRGRIHMAPARGIRMHAVHAVRSPREAWRLRMQETFNDLVGFEPVEHRVASEPAAKLVGQSFDEECTQIEALAVWKTRKMSKTARRG